jgi:signal transduction histidine kinase
VKTQTTNAERALAPVRGLALWALTLPTLALGVMLMVALALTGAGLGVLLVPPVVVAVRGVLGAGRRLVGAWTSQRIERPYLPEAEDDNLWQRYARLLSDPATWRDLGWIALGPIVASFTALLPAFLLLYGLYGFLLAGFVGRVLVEHGGHEWYAFVPIGEGYPSSPLWLGTTVALGTVFMVTGFLSGPRLLGAYGQAARSLLGPTERSRLALRVRHLTETRHEAVDASAAELRRIERDLHDGAQARLVAMGMSLGAIERLLDKDPEKARLLLAETRVSSAKALGELRDLVRGIHPPVLADRGLGDAVRALALDHPLDTEVTVELPGRLEPPVESAAFFAVSEVLTNVAKHARARRVWIDLRHQDGTLRISVTDDGRGGATLEAGTGLRGIERRIATFDGVLALNSPPGGPTLVTMELPCAITPSPTTT